MKIFALILIFVFLYILLEKMLLWIFNQGTSTEEREQLAALDIVFYPSLYGLSTLIRVTRQVSHKLNLSAISSDEGSSVIVGMAVLVLLAHFK